MKDSDWMNAIDFDSLIDDGFIFIWVTNGKGTNLRRCPNGDGGNAK
jgi:hypothetical protein